MSGTRHPFHSAGDLAGRTQADVQALLNRQLAPLGQRAMAAISVQQGERVIDIGCGTGQTTLELANMVGPEGEVIGIDLSPAALDAAREKTAHLPHVRLVQADAQTFRFAANAYDAAFSRFGVMFFGDPVSAFRNIRRALKLQGRLGFVCWRALAQNDLDLVPLKAAWPHLSKQDDDPGSAPPFSFADPDRVGDILQKAGFSDIVITPFDQLVGTADAGGMLELSLRVGSLGKMVREAPELRGIVLAPVQKALAAFDGPQGIRLNAATWIVTARSATAI